MALTQQFKSRKDFYDAMLSAKEMVHRQ
jgi:hypothetical protein